MKTQNLVLIGVGTLLTGIVGYRLLKSRMAAQNNQTGNQQPATAFLPIQLPVSNTKIPIDVYDEASQDVVINEPPKSLVRTIMSNEQPINNAIPFAPNTLNTGFATRDFRNFLPNPENSYLSGLKLR